MGHPGNGVKVDIPRSRQSRAFHEEERLWAGDLKRIINIINDHVRALPEEDEQYVGARVEELPGLTLAIFGPQGSGKTSLLKTLVADAQDPTKGPDSPFKNIAALDVIQPTRFREKDHLLYATVAAGLDAHRRKEGDRFDYEVITPVLRAYRKLSEHLNSITAKPTEADMDSYALSAEIVQRHTSSMRLTGELNTFFNALANNLTGKKNKSVVLLPVDDLDLSPDHLLEGLRELQAYMLHPRLIPVFCFTDRLAEEILAGKFAEIVAHADANRRDSSRLRVSEQLAVQFLAKCFPIRNRLRLSQSPAILQGGMIKPIPDGTDQEEPTLLTLGAASFLLYGVQDRTVRHPVVAALRPSTLRRQFHVLDAMREVGVDRIISANIVKMFGYTLNKVPKYDQPWGKLFDRAAWTLFNVHRDILRENGMVLEDLYSWTPHALRRVILEALFHLPPTAQVGLWHRWRSLTDSRRSQVLSLLAANTYRPWLPAEQASGEELQQVLDGNKQASGSLPTALEIPALLSLQWFLDLTVCFYLPFSRSVFRNIGFQQRKSKRTKYEPLSGAGWSLHSAPINAAIAADDDHKLLPTGMMFLDPLSYSIALTNAPRIRACRILDDLRADDTDSEKLKKAKSELLHRSTKEALKEKSPEDESVPTLWETIGKILGLPMKEVGDNEEKVKRKHKKGEYQTTLVRLEKEHKEVADWEAGKAAFGGNYENIPSGNNASNQKDFPLFLKNHKYSAARGLIFKSDLDEGEKRELLRKIHGLEAASVAVHDDQLLLRIWTCYGYNRGRFWSTVSLWRGLGLIGQLIESFRRWHSDTLWKGEKLITKEKEKELIEKVGEVLHTHSLRGLVPGKDLFDDSQRGNLELAFPSWDTNDQRQAINRLAKRITSWLWHSRNHDITPLQEASENLNWSECVIRRLHGPAIVGSLWQWLDVEILEHQGAQYGRRRHFYWSAGVALSSWFRVLQRYFERALELRWMLESCPLTSPFLSRIQNDPFLNKLLEKQYDELLIVVEEFGRKNDQNNAHLLMRQGEHFRAITETLYNLWRDCNDRAIMGMAGVEGEPPKTRARWNEVAGGVLENLLAWDSTIGKTGWFSIFSDEEKEKDQSRGKDVFEKMDSIARLVRRKVWSDIPEKYQEASDNYQRRLLASFSPKVKERHIDNEDHDVLDTQSACFEIASIIHQHWKLCAHASAASLFYQVPRVNRKDFFPGNRSTPS